MNQAEFEAAVRDMQALQGQLNIQQGQIAQAQANFNQLVANYQAGQQPAAAAAAPAGQGNQDQGRRNIIKELEQYARKIHICDGSNQEDLRTFLDKVDNAQVWTTANDQEMIRFLGALVSGSLATEIRRHVWTEHDGVRTWEEIKTHIRDTFLGEDEPQYKRDLVEKCRQTAFETTREYSRRFSEFVSKAYTPDQQIDPIRQERLVKLYIEGIRNSNIRVQTHLIRPANLDAAIEQSIATSRALEMAGEGKATKKNVTFPLQRQEEDMECGAMSNPMELQMREMLATMKVLQQEVAAMKAGRANRIPKPTEDTKSFVKKCWICKQEGHFKASCPIRKNQGGGDRPNAPILPTARYTPDKLQQMEHTIAELQHSIATMNLGDTRQMPNMAPAQGNA